MTIPKAVRDAAEAADKAMDDAQALIDLPNDPAAPKPSPETQASPAEPAIAEPIEAPQAPSTLEALQIEVDRERQLRKTMEGRLRSQLKPANEEIRKLRKEIEEARESMTKLQVESKKPGVERFLSKDEAEEMGDVLDLNKRMVKGILEEELESGDVAEAISKLINQNAEVRSEKDFGGPSPDFWDVVDLYHPGASDINDTADDGWIDYLDSYDSVTGVQYRAAAEAAMSDDDPSAMAAIFKAFVGVVADDSELTNKRSIRPEKANVIIPLNNKVNEQESEAFTEAEIRAFFTDVSKGKFRGREKEADEIEQKIMLAAAAGLIT